MGRSSASIAAPIMVDVPLHTAPSMPSQDELIRQALRRRMQQQGIQKQKETGPRKRLEDQKQLLHRQQQRQQYGPSAAYTTSPTKEEDAPMTQDELLQQAMSRKRASPAANATAANIVGKPSILGKLEVSLRRSLFRNSNNKNGQHVARSEERPARSPLGASMLTNQKSPNKEEKTKRSNPPCQSITIYDDESLSDFEDEEEVQQQEQNLKPNPSAKTTTTTAAAMGAALESSLRLGRSIFSVLSTREQLPTMLTTTPKAAVQHATPFNTTDDDDALSMDDAILDSDDEDDIDNEHFFKAVATDKNEGSLSDSAKTTASKSSGDLSSVNLSM